MHYHPLIDTELHRFIAAGGVDSCPSHLVNPASINLTIGSTAIIEVPEPDSLGYYTKSRQENISLENTSQERPYMVDAGEWINCDVEQDLHLPDDHEAQVILRSSAARQGWDHALAGFVDPGYHGRLTLEFVNCRRYGRLPIYRGLQLVQLRIYQLPQAPERPYRQTGRYYGAQRVEANKDPSLDCALTLSRL